MNVKGHGVTEDDAQLEELLSNLTSTFSLAKAAPKSAEDILGVYGLKFESAEGTALQDVYSIPPMVPLPIRQSSFAGYKRILCSIPCGYPRHK